MALSDALKLRDALYATTDELKNEEKTAFLPYSSISSLLSNHPLMSKMQVSKSEVHKCIAYMLKTYTTDKERASTKCASTNAANASKNETKSKKNTCVHCNHMLVLSERDGDFVCTKCGAVSESKVYGTAYCSTDDASIQNYGADPANIPEWMFVQNSFKDLWKELKISEMVEHWNAYVNLKEDDLVHVKTFCGWMTQRASNENRVAASFLFFYILSRVQPSDLNNNFHFPTIEYETTRPMSTCKNCNEKLFDQYSINRHRCFNLDNKRKQWSLVKNKKTRMKII